jgi:thioesterase domain-containing protein
MTEVRRRTRLLARGAAVAVLVLLAACVTAPPVQEMSDARQAIQAAEEAGAAALAPEALREAKRLLTSAERKLQREAYASARQDAREARRRAAEALEAARANED